MVASPRFQPFQLNAIKQFSFCHANARMMELKTHLTEFDSTNRMRQQSCGVEATKTQGDYSMKKVQSDKKVTLKQIHPEIEKAVELVDEAPLNKQDCNKRIQAVRPQSVDPTHRFGKRSGST
jgi:hypothetical protein